MPINLVDSSPMRRTSTWDLVKECKVRYTANSSNAGVDYIKPRKRSKSASATAANHLHSQQSLLTWHFFRRSNRMGQSEMLPKRPGGSTSSRPDGSGPPMEASNQLSDEAEPSSTVEEQLEDQSSRLPFPRLLAAYLCLCLCYFTSYLDMNAVTTALPTIANALDAGPSITWAGTAYLLGQTVFQPLYGRLSDITGRKPILLASVTCIMVGGLLCGFAQNPSWLYAARALSGIGGGGISSTVAIIVSDLVSLKERGKYQGMISLAIGAGATVGPFAAASLVRFPDGWRWTFWVPSILAGLSLVLLPLSLPLKPVAGRWQDKAKRIDWLGIAVSVSGIVLLLVCVQIQLFQNLVVGMAL